MSGFVAVVNVDGAPVDAGLLHRLTDIMQFRGPDAQQVWIGDQVGFGHAMLRTTDEASRERQPCSLDGTVWLTGDLRVDARKELVRSLEAAGQNPQEIVTDAELILHAYRAWGEALVDHLIGDFSFAIWDSHRRSLFCARDQMGVRPFFYSVTGRQLIISNTLSCLRAHPSISGKLNDAAIGDFLLFGFNADPATTTFRDIERLPSGHTLTWSPGVEPRVTRYWALPRYEELRLPRQRDYVERFKELLGEAVADRLRIDNVLIHMSGGLDSPLIAATALDVRAQRERPANLAARTVVYDQIFRDEERHFAQMVAVHLRMPIQFIEGDNYPLFEVGERSPFASFEPTDDLARPSFMEATAKPSDRRCRVALTGFDGDALLSASWSRHLADHASSLRLGSFIADAFRYARAKRQLSAAILRRLPLIPRPAPVRPSFPDWLEPAFERRWGLKQRWEAMPRHDDHPEGSRASAYRALTHPAWLPLLDGFDAGATGLPLDHRHPLLDLRLIAFGLSLPAIPWCIDKYVMREAAAGVLPEPVRWRPKSPLAEDPLPFAIRTYLERHPMLQAAHPLLGSYIDLGCLPRILDEVKVPAYWVSLRVLILNFWLSRLEGD